LAKANDGVGTNREPLQRHRKRLNFCLRPSLRLRKLVETLLGPVLGLEQTLLPLGKLLNACFRTGLSLGKLVETPFRSVLGLGKPNLARSSRDTLASIDSPRSRKSSFVTVFLSSSNIPPSVSTSDSAAGSPSDALSSSKTRYVFIATLNALDRSRPTDAMSAQASIFRVNLGPIRGRRWQAP